MTKENGHYWICTVARAEEKTGRNTPGEIFEFYARKIGEDYAKQYLRLIRDEMAEYAAEIDRVLNAHADVDTDRR